ncbi:MAG: amidohydrolase family protein [Spirochaetota bacterium]
MIIDTHTHAFPDKIAAKAIAGLEAGSGEKALLDGTVSDLLRSMDRSGVDTSFVLNIATKPEQFVPMLAWSKAVRSERIVPFLSIHPDDPCAVERLSIMRDEGFIGIKLHPYYQGFVLNEPKMMPIYEALSSLGLILICHTGFDIAYPRNRICDPEKIADVITRFPKLKFVATHFGAWLDYDEVKKHLIGKDVYIEISFSLKYMSVETARELFDGHSHDRIMFGTDSPWDDQAKAIRSLDTFGFDAERKAKLLGGNAAGLIGAVRT